MAEVANADSNGVVCKDDTPTTALMKNLNEYILQHEKKREDV